MHNPENRYPSVLTRGWDPPITPKMQLALFLYLFFFLNLLFCKKLLISWQAKRYGTVRRCPRGMKHVFFGYVGPVFPFPLGNLQVPRVVQEASYFLWRYLQLDTRCPLPRALQCACSELHVPYWRYYPPSSE